MAVFASLLGVTISAGMPATLAPIPVLLIVTPLNYLLSRLIVVGRGPFS